MFHRSSNSKREAESRAKPSRDSPPTPVSLTPAFRPVPSSTTRNKSRFNGLSWASKVRPKTPRVHREWRSTGLKGQCQKEATTADDFHSTRCASHLLGE